MAYESLKEEIRQHIKTNGQNEITGQILQDVLIDMVNQYPSLDGYATQQWVENQGYISEADLTNYATQTWVGQNFLALNGGGTISNNNDYSLNITENGLRFYYNGSVVASLLVSNTPDGPVLDISSDTTIGGYTIWNSGNLNPSDYMLSSTAVINSVTGDELGHLTLTGPNFSATALDFSHQHRWEELIDVPTTLRDLGITEEYLLLSGGTMTGSIRFPADQGIVLDIDNSILVDSTDSSLCISAYDSVKFFIGNTEKVSISSTDINLAMSSGNVGIGTISPSYKLDVYGQTMIRQQVGIGTAPTTSYSLDIDGTARASSFVNNSDIRKKDVIEYDVDPGFEMIANAPTIRFMWKDRGLLDNRGECVGSIAQYWQMALPEAVMTDSEGYLSMQYDVIALIAAVSVAKRVASHEKRIEELERENALLRMDIKALKGEA